MGNLRDLEKIFKGLANRRRLVIVKFLLSAREATVAEIAERLRLSIKSTSKHLAILRQLDIVDNRQDGLSVYYRLSDTLPKVVGNVIKHISNSHE